MSEIWNIPPLDLALTEKEIHIWRAALDVPITTIQKLYKILSLDERARAQSFHFERDRKWYIVSRGILRSILGSYLSVKPKRIQFRYGVNGKPMLADTFSNGPIYFNMSDSQGLALYAFNRDREIGVDIESISDISEMDQIAEQFFSIKENDVFRSLPENMKKEAFFNCWTRKEAFIKAIRDGLAMPLNSFDVTLVPGLPAKLINIAGDLKEAAHWSLQALAPTPGYIGAVAVEGHDWHFACWHYIEY